MSSKQKEDEAKKDPRDAVNLSCRGPVLFLAFSAIAWLLVYSLFAMLSGVKVHASGMMADSAWLSYGRILPAADLALQFGFLVQLGLGISAWVLSHRGKTVLVDGGYLYLGGIVWNLGVTLGFIGILSGHASGLEGLAVPGHVLPFLFTGFVLIGVSLVQTNNRRTDMEMSPAQWFIFAATVWLPWVLGAAYLLIHFFDAKGVMANIIDWWFIHNFTKVYLTFVALGVMGHFSMSLTGREVIGRGYAVFAFWVLLLFGSVGGVSPGAPVPAWLPALSTVTAVFYFAGVVAIWHVLRQTQKRAVLIDEDDPGSFNLMRLALMIFATVSVIDVCFAFPELGSSAEFTTFGPAFDKLYQLGFVGLALLGALYHIFPRLAGVTFCPRLCKLQTLAYILGVLCATLPSALGGLMSGDAELGSGFYFASVGDLLLLLASFVLFFNFLGALVMAMKRCECLARLLGRGDEKEAKA
jgi:cytochrome c oxidase cbb3-type subunit 1